MQKIIRRRKSTKFKKIMAAILALSIIAGLSLFVIAYEGQDIAENGGDTHISDDSKDTDGSPTADDSAFESDPDDGDSPPSSGSCPQHLEEHPDNDADTGTGSDMEYDEKYDDNYDDAEYEKNEEVCYDDYDDDDFDGKFGHIIARIEALAEREEVETLQELIDALADAANQPERVVIALTQDITLTGQVPITVPSGADVVLTGGFRIIGHLDTQYWLSTPHNGSILVVEGGSNLTLEGITVTTASPVTGNQSRGIRVGVWVRSGGQLFLRTGGEITGIRAFLGAGAPTAFGATHAVLNYGVFTMEGGRIFDNGLNPNTSGRNIHGSAVLNNGTFIMRGGEISGNRAFTSTTTQTHGGAAVRNYGSFTMSGGLITDNHSGHGVVRNTESGTFTMNGGQISGNSAPGWLQAHGGGGVRNYGTFVMNAGTISENRAGGNTSSGGSGVLNSGHFTMRGGHIDRNILDNTDARGGVHNRPNGTFIMEGGSISNNIGNHGVVNLGVFSMSGGAISGNGNEGVVNSHIFEMSDGIISLNGRIGVFTSNTFTMTGGEIYRNGGAGVYNESGNMILDGGIISHNAHQGVVNFGAFRATSFRMISGEISNHAQSHLSRGVETTNGAVFIMEGGRITGNTATRGGGVLVGASSSFTMEGGEISGNTATVYGGGVYHRPSSIEGPATFIINGGRIFNNSAPNGGAIASVSPAGGQKHIQINGGEISGNNATNNGGGVYILGPSGNNNITIRGGTISGNTAGNNGGGIYVTGTTTIANTITIERGTISGNVATNGGGIFTHNYASLFVEAPVIFSNNRAATASQFRNPADNDIYLSNIHPHVAWTTPFVQGFNNFDINHDYQALFLLTYVINHGTGTAQHGPRFLAPGDNINLAPAPTRASHTFDGWDDDGTTRPAGSPFTMPAGHVTLYDMWRPGSPGGGTPGGNGGGGDPGNADPGNTDPGNADPGNADPGNADPGNADPGNADPGNVGPGGGTNPGGNGGVGDGNGSAVTTTPTSPTTPPTTIIPFTPTPAAPIVLEEDAVEEIDEATEPEVTAIAALPEITPTTTEPAAQPQAAIHVETADILLDIPTAAETFFWLDDPDVPLIGNTPIWAPLGELAWSLVNLILAAAGLIIAGIYTTKYFKKKKSERDNKTQDFENAATSGDYVMENTQNAEDISDEGADEGPRKRLSWLTLACIFSGVSALLFAIFQNMNNPMVLIDFWTVAHLALFIGELVAIKSLNKKDKNNKEDIFQSA